MDTLRQDLRNAFYAMRRSPGFAASAILTLAVSIGGATAVFSVVHAVLIRDLPYPHADRLVRLWEEQPGGVSPAGNRWLSIHTYGAWRDRAATLDALGGFFVGDFTVSASGDGRRVVGARVSPSVFTMLDAMPALGRLFTPGDAASGSAPVVVLSDDLWRRWYGGNPAAVGQSLAIDGTSHLIVGVARPGLDFPERAVQLWVPYPLADGSRPNDTSVFSALGRLRAGITPPQAASEGTMMARSVPRGALADFFFGKGGPVIVHARPLLADTTGPLRPALIVMSIAAALVLLIGCANVAGLLLARGIARERELAIRAALGGTRLRLARQLVTESAVLALAGGALGCLLAWWLVRVVPALAPHRLPRIDGLHLDAAGLGYGLLATAIAAIAAGVLPAFRSASVRYDALAQRSPGAERRPSYRLRQGLLAVEAACAAILIVGSSMLAHSFLKLTQVDPGYSSANVLTASVELPAAADAVKIAQFVDAALPAVRAMPGVLAAGGADMIPLAPGTAVTEVRIREEVAGGKEIGGRTRVYTITEGYAEAIGLRLVAGRFFQARDASGRRPMIVNEEFVRQYLPRRQVVGLVLPGMLRADERIDTEIVGVVRNVLKDGNAGAAQPEIYLLDGAADHWLDAVTLVIKTVGNPTVVAADLKRLVSTLDPAAVVDPIQPLSATLSESFARPRFAASIVSGFAGLALLLAAVGLYGVLSHSVAQRRRELGVMAALGANRADLVSSVLREGLSWTVLGLGLGGLAAGALARTMRDRLFEVGPWDPVAFGSAALLLIAVSLAACIVPASRAASTDPAAVLRGE